ncbi:MAG: hypothetical protein JXK08_09975 [Flavobacteriaceae bacterium]|nr:hypothetical protein [Flavobacteriaceae bacterium]
MTNQQLEQMANLGIFINTLFKDHFHGKVVREDMEQDLKKRTILIIQ